MNKALSKTLKTTAGLIGGSAGFLTASFLGYIPFVISDAKKDYNEKCDYLLILGGNVIGADTPSPQLFERMKRAVNYLHENPDVVAVPCGGCFREGQKKSEAAIIRDYLVEHGIDSGRIHLEDRSTTTFENFEFGLKIIEDLSGKKRDELKIGILSSSYHMHRAGIIAKRNGIKEILRVSAVTPGNAFPRFIREYFVGYELLYHGVPVVEDIVFTLAGKK